MKTYTITTFAALGAFFVAIGHLADADGMTAYAIGVASLAYAFALHCRKDAK